MGQFVPFPGRLGEPLVIRISNGGGDDAFGTAADEPQRPGDHDTGRAADTDTVALRRALAATERRLGAALRELESLRRQEALRTQELQLLTAAAEKAQRFAYHDELTGLPNRNLLTDRFQQAAALAARSKQQLALLFLDMDGFKHVNNTLGHAAGDQLLQQLATRLVGCVRASDTVCRFGGDEFVLLLPELHGKEGAVVVAENIRLHFAAPYLVDGDAITMTTSIGIAVHPLDADSYGDLIRMANQAMNRDKARRPAAPGICAPDSKSGKHSGRVLSLLGSDD
jgi:diguanylate cyclase (GGDEF)-like protein